MHQLVEGARAVAHVLHLRADGDADDARAESDANDDSGTAARSSRDEIATRRLAARELSLDDLARDIALERALHRREHLGVLGGVLVDGAEQHV